MAKIIILDGPLGGTEVPLDRTVTVGRHSSNTLVLPDEGVSKHHGQIELRGENHWLVDQGSLNGCYVSRRRVKEQELYHRDELRIGSTRMLFIDPLQARQQALGLSISFEEESQKGVDLDAETTAVFKLPDYSEPDELGRFMEEFEKLHVAFRLGSELTGILDEDELGDKVLEKLFEVLPADRGCLFLGVEGSAELAQRVIRDVTRPGESLRRLDVCRPLVRTAAAKKLGVLVQDLALDPRFAEQAAGQKARSALAVPLVARGLVLGVIYVDNIHRPRAFTADDMDLVLGMGVQAAGAIENIRLYRDVEGEREARERVSRYLSPNLVERVVKDDSINLGGEKADITVLFADLRGFTPLAETMAPDEVVVMLNEFFELAVDLIFKFGGTLDKFIGDAVMAFWGVPVSRSIDPHLTVLAALKLQGELRCLNERRRKLRKDPLGLGVGIHSGMAVAGNIGTQQRMDYTVIGDTVNLASRIQDLAPGGQVLVSSETRARMGNLLIVTRHPESRVQGRRGAVDLFRVHGMYLQEKVAHELRRVRRMQTALSVELVTDGEEERRKGVLVDLSPAGAGLLFEDTLRVRFELGARVSVEVVEAEGYYSGHVCGTVVSVREAFERSGTVYLHVGLSLGEDGIPVTVREFFFANEE